MEAKARHGTAKAEIFLASILLSQFLFIPMMLKDLKLNCCVIFSYNKCIIFRGFRGGLSLLCIDDHHLKKPPAVAE